MTIDDFFHLPHAAFLLPNFFQAQFLDRRRRLLIEFPEEYPAKAPNIYFVTPILHLNVNAQVSVYFFPASWLIKGLKCFLLFIFVVAQGRVCHSALLRDYMPDVGIDHLLQVGFGGSWMAP